MLTDPTNVMQFDSRYSTSVLQLHAGVNDDYRLHPAESTHSHTHTLCRSYAQYAGLAVCFCQPLLYEHAVIACAQYTETFICSILLTSVMTHRTYTACTCTGVQ